MYLPVYKRKIIMRISAFSFPVFKPYKKATMEIYFQGCVRNTCTGTCHNPELRDPKGGKEITVEEIVKHLDERKLLFDCISFTGGEPLQQGEKELYLLALDLKNKFPDKELWLFTGEPDFDEIPGWCKELFDVIKFGGYMESLKTGEFPASSNQKVVKRNGT
jgi:organic radical activating enzyme